MHHFYVEAVSPPFQKNEFELIQALGILLLRVCAWKAPIYQVYGLAAVLRYGIMMQSRDMLKCSMQDHASKGIKQCTMVLGGVRCSIIAANTFGWVGLGSLTDTKDSEDRR
jgi:hypothetical protein